MHHSFIRFAVVAATALGVAGCEQPQRAPTTPAGIRLDPTATARLRPILAAMREQQRSPAPLPESTAAAALSPSTHTNSTISTVSAEERALRANVHQREGSFVSRTSMSMEVPR